MMCRFHVQTAGSSLTAQSVDNNVVRTTVQALAAVLGGAQSLHTNSRDEALALPTAEAARLALRTQQILAYEVGGHRDARPARRQLLRRDADGPAGGGGPHLAEIEAHGRHAGGDRGRLPAAPDPGVRLPRNGRSSGRPGRRGGEPLPGRRRPRRRRPCGSIPTPRCARSSGPRRSGRSAITAHGRPPSAGSRSGPGHDNLVPPSSKRSAPMPRWARSPTACAGRGASIAS